MDVLKTLARMARYKREGTGRGAYDQYYETVEYPQEKLTKMGSMVLDDLIATLDSDTPKVRFYAIKILGNIQLKEALAPLEALNERETNSENSTLLRKVIVDLKENGITHEERLQSLLDTIQGDADQDTKYEALNAISDAYKEDPTVVDPLLTLLNETQDLHGKVLSVLSSHQTSEDKIIDGILSNQPEDPANDKAWSEVLLGLSNRINERTVSLFVESVQYPKRKYWYTTLRKFAEADLLTDTHCKTLETWALEQLADENGYVSQTRSIIDALSMTDYSMDVRLVTWYINGGFGTSAFALIPYLAQMPPEISVPELKKLLELKNVYGRIDVYKAVAHHKHVVMLDDLKAQKTKFPDMDDTEQRQLDNAIEILSTIEQ